MLIGVAGPFNPQSVKEYFPENTELPDINRTASSVNAYVNGLLKNGHQVVVFTTYPFDGKSYKIVGNRISICFISTKFKVHAFGRARMGKKIARAIKENNDGIDVLHAQWTYEFALAALHFKGEKPLFCSVRDWCPYIMTLSEGFMEKYYWTMSYFIFKKVMKGDSFKFIANSEYTKSQIVGDYPQKDVAIIPNPIDSKFILNTRTSYSENPVFISISYSVASPRKNNIKLLEAFHIYHSENPNASLILIGACPEDLKKNLEEKGLLEGVILKGLQDHDEVIRLIDESTCLVHPAIEETFGNILLEGMCRRVPCIGGAEAGAVPQVLGYGKYGVLCDVTNAQSIYNAMKKIEDPDLFQRLVNDSTEYLLREFPDTVVAQKHIELFKKNMN